MSFTGGSISQGALISSQDSRLAAVESLAASKVAQAAYDAKVALLDAKDVEQDSRIMAVESVAASKVAQAVYDAKVAVLDAKDAEHDARLGAIDAKDIEHEARLDAVEGRATALESDIAGRVQSAIDEKVAQTVFDSLASELRSADSALTAALATKVAATTQSAVDALQDSAIATKASITSVNNALGNLQGQINAKVATSAYQAKVDALEEFINILLQTYTITKPSGGNYAYTGVKQNLLVSFTPENPINVVASGNAISFDLPNTVAQLDFVDVNIAGTWYHILRSSLSINGVSVAMVLPVEVTGEVLIYTRYDAYSGSPNAGFYRIAP